MNLAGFVPLSLCDFPGRVAAVVFTQGCNFRCPWCHNGHLIPLAADAARRVSEAEVFEVLEARRTRLGGVVVSGGEPTLQPALPRFLRRIKALGLEVKLDTNGSRPEVLRGLLRERLVDFIAMDVKAPWTKYATLTGTVCCDVAAVQASLALIATSGSEVGAGVQHVGRTGEALGAILERISDVDRLVSEITASAREQASGLEAVNAAVSQMDQLTQQNAAMVEETSAAAEALKDQAQGLDRLVARFRLPGRSAERRRVA